MIKLISNRNINDINEPILVYYSSNKGNNQFMNANGKDLNDEDII